MKRFKFFLDSVEVSDPRGWDKMVETMSRDQSLKGIFITHDTPLEFTGDAYKILWVKKSDGFCTQTNLTILESCNLDGYYELIYEGILETSDCEFNLLKRICKVKVNDNTFYAKINNNKTLECFLIAGLSKNNIPITPIVQNDLMLFNPSNGAPGSAQLKGCFKIYDVLKYLIAFMSDGDIDFDSNIFGIGGEFENLILTNGYVIRNTGIFHQLTDAEFKYNLQTIKYQTLFQEIEKRLNLGFYFDLSGIKPKLIIEKYDDTKIQDVIIDVPKVKEIFESYFVNKLYSSIKFGTSKINDDITLSFPEQIRFVGFKQEEYNILGKCNLDNPLDLTCNYITSSNVIERIYIQDTSDVAYDTDWFLIDCDNIAGVLTAKNTNWIEPSPPLFYNERLNNNNIAIRYLGAVPNSIALFLGNGNDEFMAHRSTNVNITTLGGTVDDFTIEVSDPNGNYNNTTSRYTCPAPGAYIFNAQAYYTAIHLVGVGSFILLRITFKNITTGLTQYALFYTTSTSHPVNFYEATFIASGGDVISCEFDIQIDGANPTGSTVRLEKTSYFTCINAATGGGIYQTYDPNNYPINKFTFNCPLSRENHTILKRNIIKAITFNDGKHFYKGWIDTLKYNLKTSEANVTIISSKNFQP